MAAVSSLRLHHSHSPLLLFDLIITQQEEGSCLTQLVCLILVEAQKSRKTSSGQCLQLSLFCPYHLWPADISPSIVFIVNDRMPAFSGHSILHSLPWIRTPHASPTSSNCLGKKTGVECGNMFTRFKNDNSPSKSNPAALPARKSLKAKFSLCPLNLGIQRKNTGLPRQMTPPKDERDGHGLPKTSGRR